MMGEIMLEQLRYDMITGLFHHKKRALLVIISVLLTYCIYCRRIGNFLL